MNKQAVDVIRALPERCLWYVDDYVLKGSPADDASCDIYESECFNRLRPGVKDESQNCRDKSSCPELEIPSDLEAQADLFESILNKMTQNTCPSAKRTEELANSLLGSFDGVCTCKMPGVNSVLGKLVIAVEMVCRGALNEKDILTVRERSVSKDNAPANIEYIKGKISHHAKWLLSDNPDRLTSLPGRDLKYLDIVFISRRKFGSLLDKFMTTALNKDQKCSHEVAKTISEDRELTVVALFATKYRFVLYSAEPMLFKFRLEIEEMCDEIKEMGVGRAVKCVQQIGSVFCDGTHDVLNRFTRQEETIDILTYPTKDLKLFIAGLLKEYKEFRRMNPKGVDEKKIENYDIYCNPVYRQIFVLMEMRDRGRQIGLFS